MKVLYAVNDAREENTIINAMNKQENWEVTQVDSKGYILTCCSTRFYDVIVIDSTIENFQWSEIIKTIRDRQIFTPILVITGEYSLQNRTCGMAEGADMCLAKPFNKDDIMLMIRTLKRRNANYQAPTISFEGVSLNRPDGKICFDNTSFSVNPIEIEIFRLLVRATAPIHIGKLAEKINEPEDKIIFCAQSLQKKIGLLNSSIRLEIKNSKCRLIKKR